MLQQPLHIFHLNPNTLKTKTKQEAFRRQVSAQRFVWASFPETRNRESGISVEGDYFVARAACDDDGFGGCSIYINGSVAIGEKDGDKLFTQEQNISILHADPRRLLVCVQTQAFTTYGVCLHAYDVSKGVDAVLQRWKSTTSTCSKHIPRGSAFLCSIDSNMRIRTSKHPWIGEELDPHGTSGADQQHIDSFVEKYNLSVINTHSEFVDPSTTQGAYIPTIGQFAVRCDYFLATPDYGIVPRSFKFDKKFQLHAESDDHLPIAVQVYFPLVARHPIVKRCTATYSRLAVQLEPKSGPLNRIDRSKRVDEGIRAIQSTPVMIDHASHAHIVNNAVGKIVAMEFPLESKVPRAPWMTQSTYHLTVSRSVAWDFLTMLGRRIKNAVPRYTFRVWAHYAGIVHKPSWCGVRGPATREICYRQLHEKRNSVHSQCDGRSSHSNRYCNHDGTKSRRDGTCSLCE